MKKTLAVIFFVFALAMGIWFLQHFVWHSESIYFDLVYKSVNLFFVVYILYRSLKGVLPGFLVGRLKMNNLYFFQAEEKAENLEQKLKSSGKEVQILNREVEQEQKTALLVLEQEKQKALQEAKEKAAQYVLMQKLAAARMEAEARMQAKKMFVEALFSEVRKKVSENKGKISDSDFSQFIKQI